MKYGDIGRREPLNYIFTLWVYSISYGLEVKKGSCHSVLNEDETPWMGCSVDEMARGKFNSDMSLGSIAFNSDNISIQRKISDELQCMFKRSVLYVFGSPNQYGGEGVLLEKFMEE